MNELDKMQRLHIEVTVLVDLLEMEQINLNLDVTQRGIVVDILKEKVTLLGQQVNKKWEKIHE